MTRLTALIVDDEPLAREGLQRLCVQDGRIEIVGTAGDAGSVAGLVAAERPDLVFLDIGMPGSSGMEIAAQLNRMTARPAIVFVTAYDHFAAEAFDLAVVDYVLKPVERGRFGRAIDRVAALVGARGGGIAADNGLDGFWAPYRGSLVRVPLAAIDSVEAEGDYVRLRTASASYLMRQSMAAMADRLPPDRFTRIHRSTIVRRDRVVQFRHLGGGAWAAVDPAGQVFRIGRSYLAGVRQLLGMPPAR